MPIGLLLEPRMGTVPNTRACPLKALAEQRTLVSRQALLIKLYLLLWRLVPHLPLLSMG